MTLSSPPLEGHSDPSHPRPAHLSAPSPPLQPHPLLLLTSHTITTANLWKHTTQHVLSLPKTQPLFSGSSGSAAFGFATHHPILPSHPPKGIALQNYPLAVTSWQAPRLSCWLAPHHTLGALCLGQIPLCLLQYFWVAPLQ